MNKHKIRFIANVSMWIMIYSLFAVIGFAAGMIYEQVLITQSVGRALSYADVKVDVNFNESKLVDEINQKVIPGMKSFYLTNSSCNDSVCKSMGVIK